MPDSAARLPARPSLEQLRKQAKDLLQQVHDGHAAAIERLRARIQRAASAEHAGDITLADVQFVLAREYGFESWARLKQHVEAATLPALKPYLQLAEDLVAALPGDVAALQRVADHFGVQPNLEELRAQVERRLTTTPGLPGDRTTLSLAEAQRMVAGLYGFGNWTSLVESLAQPAADPRTAPLGMSSSPPFYRIDWTEKTLEPRPPLSDQDWDTIFGVMKELGLTGLRGGGQLTDAAMARLAQLDFVTRLEMGGSNRVTDEGLRHLAHMPQLRQLELGGWDSPITDRGLEALRYLVELREFAGYWSRRISDAGVANLTFCDHLEKVHLLGTPTGDGAINALAGKRRLSDFSSGQLVTDAGLRLLHQFPVFKSWQGGELRYGLMRPDSGPNHVLLAGPFTDRGVAAMAGLDGVFGLAFFGDLPALTPEALAQLVALPNLGKLGCDGKLCDDTAMRHIAALPHLRMLMAQGTVATDDGFAALSRSTTLEYLWGRECPNLTGRGFAAMAAMPALRGIAVSCKQVDDAALSSLPRFPALTDLVPMDVTDDGFRHVGGCARLEKLWCMYCRDTGDIATDHIAGLSRLKSYYAGRTLITDRSLEVLGRLTELERIELWQTGGVTDAGLTHLTGLPKLRELVLDALPNVTRQGAAIFPATVRVNLSS